MRKALLLLACLAAAPARSAPVEASHAVYAFLRKLELRGLVTPGRLTTLPRPKEEVAALLEEASRSGRLRPAETASLETFREDLGLAPAPGRFPPLAYGDSAASAGARIEYFTGGYAQDSLPRPRAFAFGSLNAAVEGEYRRRFQFVSSAGIAMERSRIDRFTENYDPQRGMPYNTDRQGKAGIPRGVSTMDAFRTVVGYRDEALRLELGTDWNQWGPGSWQHPFLSTHPWFWVQDSLPPEDSSGFLGTPDPGRYRRGFRYPGEAAPMTQIRMGFRMGIFEYVKVTAERQGLWSGSPAHVVAHRLTARPRPWLGIGLQEMVTTAGRPLDWTYIIPFVPLKYTEHQLGDRDNIAMGFDVEALWAGRGRAYGEVMLDDFSGWDAEFWGNKFAFTLGAEAVDLPAAGSVLRAEYARVEAWTFTHHRRDGQMQHFGALLGSSLPANSHALRFAWEHPLPRNVEARLEYRLLQRDVTARGSSVFDVHDEARDGRTKEFLGGTVETRHEVALGGTWRWRRFVELRGTVGYLAAEDWKGVAGEAVSGATVAGEIYLRY